jgi:hypothetical protein
MIRRKDNKRSEAIRSDNQIQRREEVKQIKGTEETSKCVGK